jgi:hypothetical protein
MHLCFQSIHSMTPAPLILIICFFLLSCNQTKKGSPSLLFIQHPDTSDTIPYDQIIYKIKKDKAGFAEKYKEVHEKKKVINEIRDYWVNSLGTDLYEQWKSTPWDFNGTTRKPKEGSIACGYFVTTLLLDMGYKLDRIKLSTCDAMTMMKKLTSTRSVENLSYLKYEDFNKRIKDTGKGVFIIGLDYHTGFLINDGTETWFLHSNYIGRKGVVKEKILESAALKQSKSRFVTCLTSCNDFLMHWLAN